MQRRAHRITLFALPWIRRSKWASPRGNGLLTPPVALTPDIRNQIVGLLVNVLVSDYRAYPTIPR